MVKDLQDKSFLFPSYFLTISFLIGIDYTWGISVMNWKCLIIRGFYDMIII
mgnify:CR=1 FL=1